MKPLTFELIERIANLLRQEARLAGAELGLQPIQQEVLHYLSRCNRYSDNPLGVAEYLGITKGTLSQTLKVLENKGLIEKHKDEQDKRLIHLVLSDEGKRFTRQAIPPKLFSQALGKVNTNQLDTALTELLRHYQLKSDRLGFGVCRHCQHNQPGPHGFTCGLTGEPLKKRELELLCREFAE